MRAKLVNEIIQQPFTNNTRNQPIRGSYLLSRAQYEDVDKPRFKIEWSFGKENNDTNYWRFFDENDNIRSMSYVKRLADEVGVLKEFNKFIEEIESDSDNFNGVGGIKIIK